MNELLQAILSGVGAVGETLDAPGAYLRGALSGRLGERASGREMLESWGALGANQEGLDGGDVAGFFADMIFDPLNVVGGAGLKAASVANKGIRAGNKASEAMRAAGAMPEEIASLTKVRNVARVLPPENEPQAWDALKDLWSLPDVPVQQRQDWMENIHSLVNNPADDPIGYERIKPFVTELDQGPRRMYHGTPHVYDAPDPSRFDRDALYGPGYYTTADPHIASEYTEKGARAIDSNAIRAQENAAYLQQRIEKLNALDENGIPDYAPHERSMTYPVPRSYATRAEWRAQLESQLAQSLQEMQRRSAPNVRMQYLDIRNPLDMDAEIPVDEINRIIRTERPKADYGAYAPLTNTLSGDFVSQRLVGTPEDFNRMLRRAGYDGIIHRGGGRVGSNHPHDVAIAFDPSQIYSPYIAPALQKEKSIAPYLAMLLGNNAAQAPYDLQAAPSSF